MIKTALISVSDKVGIVDFAKKLEQSGVLIYSTGGTAKALSEEGIEVKSITSLTNFPEILDGRVKTLHPAVHAGLLADLKNPAHRKQLEENKIRSIDLLVVNLYPFEATLSRGARHEEMIENIDIGGPAMLRAAAKNYLSTAVITDNNDYERIIEYINNGEIPNEVRLELSAKAFSHTAYYDSIISKYMRGYSGGDFSEYSIPMKLAQSLRYGENPHQNAALYGHFDKYYKKLHGKELSYNNIVDIDAAGRLIIEFEETACAIVKHTNPCGVAIADNLSDAWDKAFQTDTVSPFGGIIAFNRKVNMEIAETIHSIFTEVIIAPEFADDALELLTKKKARRLILADFDALKNENDGLLRSVAGGMLYQDNDDILFDEYKVVSKRQPTTAELKAMKFAWKVSKHVKSNAIVFTNDESTLAIGAGQMSRVDSARIATEKAALMKLDLNGSVVASDAFFPFSDGPEEAAKAGATAIIQPGGSVRDEEVIKACDENNLAMIFTGMRHFRH